MAKDQQEKKTCPSLFLSVQPPFFCFFFLLQGVKINRIIETWSVLLLLLFLAVLLGHFLLAFLIELVQFFKKLSLGLHDSGLVAPTFRAIPLSLRF